MGSSIDDVDYYGLLQVPQDASAQQIRTAYRKASIKVHPDRVSNDIESISTMWYLDRAE